jgi:glycosyltransferase involved in cell wall biosynthesis
MSFHADSVISSQIGHDLKKKNVDIVHVEQTWMAYAIPRKYRWNQALLNIHYLVESDFQSAEAPSGLRESLQRKRLIATERHLIRQFRHIRVLSDEMAHVISRFHPLAKIFVVPLPISPESYQFRATDNQAGQKPVVTMIGSMFWPPSRNATFRLIERVWPLIKTALPEAELHIVGKLANSFFQQFDGVDGIRIFDSVPEIEPFFRNAHVMIYAPEAGSGMKVKVQEAMLYGLPVVTNSIGLEGLDLLHGDSVMLGQDDQQLADSAIAVLTDPQLAVRLSVCGRQAVAEQCSPERVIGKLKNCYFDMLNS